MTKIYTYLFLLFFAFIGRGAFAQCPTETLTVEFEAYALKQNLQVSQYKKDSVIPRIKSKLASMLGVAENTLTVNMNTNNNYNYCNSSNGFSDIYSYSVGSVSTSGCPVSIKVIDKYNPNCGKKNGGNQDHQINYCPTVPTTLNISGCSVTKEMLDDFFNGFAANEIEKYNANLSYKNFADWNDEMWQNGNSVCKGGSMLKEAYIDWENTDISGFLFDGTEEGIVEVQYVLLDNAGNKGFRYRYQSDVVMPCRAKIKIKTNFGVNFLCPDQSVLSNTEVVLDLPKVPEGDYIVWNTGSKNLKDPKGKDVNSDLYAWTPAADGISVTDFPKEGVYKLTLKGNVCNKKEKSVTCPVNVIKKVETCDPK